MSEVEGMKIKFQILITCIALNTIFLSIKYPFFEHFFTSYLLYTIFIGIALVLFALPLSYLVDRITIFSNVEKLIVRYTIYIIPGFILVSFMPEIAILLLSFIVASSFFVIEFVFGKIGGKLRTIICTLITVTYVCILFFSMLLI
ncbi:hypothetical protein [Jeotgalibacillus marinus]|uniref:Yip1 domain-containing protein n=1 Tax=Jeotgalibacillus marinus TaxID=86667 RepID=A0ABV3Q7U6_9BACL